MQKVLHINADNATGACSARWRVRAENYGVFAHEITNQGV